MTIVGAPSFGDGEAGGFEADCRFQNDGERTIEVREFLFGVNAFGPRLIDTEFLGEFVQLALVAGP